MRPLREDERDEIESLKHFLKYINSKLNAEGWELWSAMLKIQEVGDKYILTKIVTEEELAELLDIDDMKEILMKLMGHIKNFVETHPQQNS